MIEANSHTAPARGPSAEPASSPLREYLAVLRRRAGLVGLILVLVPVSALLLTALQEEKYEASADLLTDRFAFSGGLLGGEAGDAERAAATQQRLARTPAVARRVIESYDNLTDLTPTEFLDSSSVSATSGADVLRFTVAAPRPERAEALASAYAREFNRYRRSLSSEAVAEARAELRARMERLRAAERTDSPLYRALTSSDEQLAAIQVLPELGAVVVEPALAAEKVAPQPVRNLILGLGLGILLATAAAFLAEALDTRVRRSEEVERILGRPVLGHLPPRKRALRKQNSLLTMAEPDSSAAEALRMLRASFDFARTEAGARSVMFTSFGDGDGSAPVVADLAVMLARAGRNVVLCDLDCRQPRIAGLLGVEDRPGITDVVAGERDLANALVAVRVDDPRRRNGAGPAHVVDSVAGSLRVLPLGSSRPISPADFVGSPAVARVLAQLATTADVVLVFAPPVLAASDAVVLSGTVDAIVLVTQLDGLHSDTLAAVERTLEPTAAPVLGIVTLAGRNASVDPSRGLEATRV